MPFESHQLLELMGVVISDLNQGKLLGDGEDELVLGDREDGLQCVVELMLL